MRLLSHNLLMCSVAKCDQNNFPLAIEVFKSVHRQSEFNPDTLSKLIKKLDWPALCKTVVTLGELDFPPTPEPFILAHDNLVRLHRILLDTHIIEGKLTCPNCKRDYPIINGIPNMILHESQI